MKRRGHLLSVWAPVLMAGALLSCGNGGAGRSPGPAQPARTLRFHDLINVDVRDVPLMLAFDELTARGYRIERTHLASGALIADALARGSADLGVVNTQTIWVAASKGAQIRTVSAFTAPTTVVAARREIANCRGLQGRRLGVPATKGMSPSLLSAYLQGECGGAKPEILVITESAGRAAALLAGEVDAVLMPREELQRIEGDAPRKFHVLLSYSTAFPHILIDGLHVRRQWAQDNPGAVEDFLRALVRAHRRVAADPELLIAESMKRLSLAHAEAKQIVEGHLAGKIWDRDGGLTARKVEDTLALLTGLGLVPASLRPEDVADLAPLQSILKEPGL
ncbi:MAG: ABC transporter substrate-binding protein [Acidobacteria bacterium]|nr:ABC transporter substrate-binding protein [Acidobacteriota bacterium]